MSKEWASGRIEENIDRAYPVVLRDMFAALALNAMLSRPYIDYPDLPGDVSYTEHFTSEAYGYADAMMKARGK